MLLITSLCSVVRCIPSVSLKNALAKSVAPPLLNVRVNVVSIPIDNKRSIASIVLLNQSWEVAIAKYIKCVPWTVYSPEM